MNSNIPISFPSTHILAPANVPSPRARPRDERHPPPDTDQITVPRPRAVLDPDLEYRLVDAEYAKVDVAWLTSQSIMLADSDQHSYIPLNDGRRVKIKKIGCNKTDPQESIKPPTDGRYAEYFVTSMKSVPCNRLGSFTIPIEAIAPLFEQEEDTTRYHPTRYVPSLGDNCRVIKDNCTLPKNSRIKIEDFVYTSVKVVKSTLLQTLSGNRQAHNKPDISGVVVVDESGDQMDVRYIIDRKLGYRDLYGVNEKRPRT